MLCVFVAEALDWLLLLLLLLERLEVLVTKLLTREVVADVVASPAVPVAVPDKVVTPTDSIEAVGTLLVKSAEPDAVGAAVEISVAWPFASVLTSLLDWPRTKPVLEAMVFPSLMMRIWYPVPKFWIMFSGTV